jgi:hypothetical protein
LFFHAGAIVFGVPAKIEFRQAARQQLESRAELGRNALQSMRNGNANTDGMGCPLSPRAGGGTGFFA